MRQPGQDPERESKMRDDVHDVLGHIGRQAGLHGDGLHPLGEVVGQRQDVSVSVLRLGQRPPDVQPQPLPRRRHLPAGRSSVRLHRSILSARLQLTSINFSGSSHSV